MSISIAVKTFMDHTLVYIRSLIVAFFIGDIVHICIFFNFGHIKRIGKYNYSAIYNVVGKASGNCEKQPTLVLLTNQKCTYNNLILIFHFRSWRK